MKAIKVTTTSQESIFETNDMALAKEAAMNYSERHNVPTFVWRKKARACSYWTHSNGDGTYTMYRGAGRK